MSREALTVRSALIPLTYRLPSAWASYLINGDDSGIDETTRRQADDFLTLWKLPAPVDCEPVGFYRWNDAHELGGDAALAQDCETYTFLVSPARLTD